MLVRRRSQRRVGQDTHGSQNPLTSIQVPKAGTFNSGSIQDPDEVQADSGLHVSAESALLSPVAIRRWCFKQDEFWYKGVEVISEKSTDPVDIQSGQKVQFELPMDGIPVGNYGLVLCAFFDNIDLNDIERWILDVRPGDDKGMLYSMENSNTTVVKKDELVGLSKGSSVRFRIHSAVDHFVATRSQFVTTWLYSVNPLSSFKVHYIELDTNILRSAVKASDRILFGECKPTHVIGVGPDDQPKTPKSIQAFDISDTGEHAVTLYYSESKAHIEVWDLKETRDNILREPYAQATISISKPLAEGSLQWPVAIDISSTGEKVTICTVVGQPDDPGIPFQVLQYAPSKMQSGIGHSEEWGLKKVKTICDGQYFALASHHRSDPKNINSDDERFWVTDGRSFTVYNTKDDWSKLYTLNMQSQPDLLAARTAMMSIHGRYFAWTGARGAISIWDFETGEMFSHLFISDQYHDTYPVLSPDGSMIAVTCSNTIQIHDTRTGIKLGIFKKGKKDKKGQDNYKYFEVVFGNDHFIVYNPEAATVSKPMKHNKRSLVRLRDMAIVETFAVHEDYRFNYPQTGGNLVFTFCHGPNLNILKMGAILSPVDKNQCGVHETNHVCQMEVLAHFTFSLGFRETLENTKRERFILTSTVDFLHGQSMRMLHITIENSEAGGANEGQSEKVSIQDGDSGSKSMSFPIGLDWCRYTGFFIRETSQLGVVIGGSLILWTLSATKPWMCKLALMWRFQEMYEGLGVDDVCLRNIISVERCLCGSINLHLTASSWYRKAFNITEEVAKMYGVDGRGILTIPISDKDTICKSDLQDLRERQERRVSQGIADLIDVYLDGNDQCQAAIIQYLRSHIRPSDENRISSLVSLCKAWKPRLRKQVEQLLGTLLPTKCITWVPINHATKETNPLAVILETAKKQSRALRSARIIMDYCVENAIRSHNLASLAPFFGCLHDIMEMYPDEAFRYLSRIAFIPVMHRSYLLDNSIVVLPPSCWNFWKPSIVPLHQLTDQVFQLRVSSKKPDPENEKFTHPVFMASFDALWRRQNPEKTLQASSTNGSIIGKTTWWKAIYHMILYKALFKGHTFVKAYNFSIEFYDHPAIAALVAYKWNTIGYWYWLVRFCFQSCFYLMVVTAAIMQVYSEHPGQLYVLFLAIIVMASFLLWLELQQIIKSAKRYARSGYNILDVLAFSLPLAASIRQLTMIQREDVHDDTHILSFSVLVVFFHILFELRIFKSVCKFVTIIQQAVVEIRVFFVIFAGGILAFTIATLHLLRACTYDGCKPPDTAFPANFLKAVSSVYFFMGGVWDPVSEGFASDNVGFHVMMVLYFFTSVVLMLNVLIALINVAFNKGDDGWRLAWIEWRLRYIEAAENMSYHIPGFRQTYNYFPDEIYFSVTRKQVQETRQKFDARNYLDMTLEEGDDDNDALEADDALEANYEDVALEEKWEKLENSVDRDNTNDRNAEDNVIQGAIVGNVQETQVENLRIAEPEDPGSYSGGSKIEPCQGNENSVPAREETLSIQGSNQGRGLIRRVGDLQRQVNSVVTLQQELSVRMATHQEQMGRQFEELKALLQQHSAL